MRATVHHLSRRTHAKAEEAQRRAKAADAADKAVLAALMPLLVDLEPDAARCMTDAVLDAALTLHPQHHGGAATSRKVCGWAGRNYPDVSVPREDKFANADAELRKVG